MRLLIILVLCLFVVACTPEGTGVVNGVKQSKEDTSRLIGQAITGDFGQTQRCMGDPDCGLGHACVNSTCVPKKR